MTFSKNWSLIINALRCLTLTRRWVLQQLIQENSLPVLVNKGNLGAAPVERIHRLVQEEMDVCAEAAGRYPSNYNAWSHRIWVLQNVGKLTIKVKYSNE